MKSEGVEDERNEGKRVESEDVWIGWKRVKWVESVILLFVINILFMVVESRYKVCIKRAYILNRDTNTHMCVYIYIHIYTYVYLCISCNISIQIERNKIKWQKDSFYSYFEDIINYTIGIEVEKQKKNRN